MSIQSAMTNHQDKTAKTVRIKRIGDTANYVYNEFTCQVGSRMYDLFVGNGKWAVVGEEA